MDIREGIINDFVESFTDDNGEPKVDDGPFLRMLCQHSRVPQGLDVWDPRVRRIIDAACAANGWETPYGED